MPNINLLCQLPTEAATYFVADNIAISVCCCALQVALNQLALAPVTLAAVFAWNLGLTGQWDALPNKITNDLVPSMINGELVSW